eukprot:gene17223-22746_t
MNLLEIVVLFGLPPPPPTTDPRLARTMRLEANSSLTKNAEDIPLYHSFINRNEIIQSAEELFSKILLWSSKNGPQGFPFSTSMIALLGELIASIGSLRPKKGSESALALVSMIQGKSSMCLQMSNNEREQLIRATNRLLKILKAYSDPDGVASKLQTALTTLQAFKSSDSQSDKKRTAAQMEGQTDTNESEEFIEQEKLEQQAKLAVDELEKQRLNNKQDNKNITEQISTSIGSNILDSSSNLQILETELVSDNSLVFDSYDIKNCVMIKLNDKQAIQPVENVHADMYKELSMFSLERLLDNYNEIINYGDQAIQTHLFLIVRTAILLSSDESSNIKVPVIQSLSYQVKYLNLTESIPTEVILPRDIFTISEARDAISTFAIQAVIDIIGIDIINKVQSSVKYKEVFHDITNDRKSNGSLSKSTDNHMEVDANEAGNGFHNYLDVNKDQNNESSTIADFTETTPTLSSIYSILKSIEIFDNEYFNTDIVEENSISEIKVKLQKLLAVITTELSSIVPAIGGFETNKLEEYLPKYIKLYYNNADVLKNVYHRIVLTRPPPMTKTALIIALHRINFEAYDIKQKSYLDSLSVCLNDDVTFTAEPIKEALKILTDDSTLPVALVRTALLASKGHVDKNLGDFFNSLGRCKTLY